MMLRRSFTAFTILAASSLAFAKTRAAVTVKTGYASVNGVNLYYEIHGRGELPLPPPAIRSCARWAGTWRARVCSRHHQ